MVLNNPSPLYELAWYPPEGLGLKSATPNMDEEKTTCAGISESCNITISSPRHSNAGENIRTGAPPATDELNSKTSKLDSEMVDFLNARTNKGFSLIKSLARELRSSRDVEPKERERIANPGKMADADHATDVGLSEINCKDLVTKENYHRSSFFAVSNFEDHVAESSKPVSSSKSPRLIYADLESKEVDEKIISTKKHVSNFEIFRAQCSSRANLENKRQQEHRPCTQHVEKGKEKVHNSEEDCGRTSKEREDSNESVESNSRKVVSKGKRERNVEFTAKIECKRLRTEGASLEPLYGKGNSFMKWISSITSSYSRCDQSNKTLAIVPQDSNGKECFDSIPELQEKSEGVRNKTRGFASVFQAIYSPNIMVGNSKHSIRLEEANDSKELNIGNPQVYDSEELNIDNHPVHKGPELNLNSKLVQNENINSVLIPHEVRPPVIGDLCNREAKEIHGKEFDHGKASSNCERITHAAGNTRLPRISEPPSSSRKNFLMCAEEDGNQALAFAPSNSVNMDIEGNFIQSSWISRFLRKDSPLSQPFVCRLEMDVVPQKLKNQNITEDRHGASSSEKKPENLVDCFASNVSRRLINTSPVQQQYSISPSVSSRSKRAEDQRSKHNLTRILPSQKFKRSEPISSIFAKRLDALRHIMPSKVADNLSCAATTCFSCGKVGHSLRNCLSLVETDLKNLLGFIKAYKGNELPTPFCIRCFQVNHWSITCPHSSMELENYMDNPLTVCHEELNTADKKPSNENSSNYDGRMILWTGDSNKEHHQQDNLNFMAQRVDSRYEVEPVSSEKCSFHEISAPTANNCYQNLSKEEYLSKCTAKSKQSVSRNWDNEAKGTEVRPSCKFGSHQVDDGQNEIFEAIRQLQLTRTEIMRLLKSESSHIRLEGFYLRLRLGKWEEGLKGTGYHVALINGVSHENCVSVSIGHQACSVNCRFVSNQDYFEDELKAWWSSNSRGKGKLPSKEELNKKLKERTELKF